MMEKLNAVGRGFFGAVVAERAASAGIPVTIFEKRNHVGEKFFPAWNTASTVHFHSSGEKVWQCVNRFGKFGDYRHHIFITCRNEVFSISINLGTVNQFYRKTMTFQEAERFPEQESPTISQKYNVCKKYRTRSKRRM